MFNLVLVDTNEKDTSVFSRNSFWHLHNVVQCCATVANQTSYVEIPTSCCVKIVLWSPMTTTWYLPHSWFVYMHPKHNLRARTIFYLLMLLLSSLTTTTAIPHLHHVE